VNKEIQQWQQLAQRRVAEHFRQFHNKNIEPVGRRAFLKHTAGAASLVLSTSAGMAQRAEDRATTEPNPIPGGAMPFGILVHHFPLPASGATPVGSINDPSEITDFNGFIGDTHMRGAGFGTGFASQLAYQTDMGFMQGEYIGVDGRHHHGTFCFI
jgi:hypothetical protein